MIATPASLRSDFIHIAGTAIHIAPECTIHITGIRNWHIYGVPTQSRYETTMNLNWITAPI